VGKNCRVQVNGQAFSANYGDLLLDAALMSGVDIPFDCRSGYCGTCSVNIVKGRVFGGETTDRETVRACQSRVISDIEVAIEEVPEVVILQGQVAKLVPLAPDVMEVVIALPEPAEYLPGQYYKLQFRGYPSRCFSRTAPLSGRHNDRLVHFHIRRVPDGRVSSQLGRGIRVGHRVKLTGPLGTAFLRPHLPNRLVLVASGTGFAPIWSIADAAMREWSERELVVVVAARKLESLYMIPALCRLARCPNVTIVPVVSETQAVSQAVQVGRPTEYMPALRRQDIVYTCGGPAMVDAVSKICSAAGAKCYCDPFEASGSEDDEENGLLSRAVRWFTGAPELLPPPPPSRPAPKRPPGPQRAARPQRAQGPQRPSGPQRAQGPQRPPGPQRTPGPQRPTGPQRAQSPQRAPGPPRLPIPQLVQGPQRPPVSRRDPTEAARMADLARYAPPKAKNKPAWLREAQY
jgi:NAD(P)H-flavin reductase/ferredoxin